jgi:hypothetical protein
MMVSFLQHSEPFAFFSVKINSSDQKFREAGYNVIPYDATDLDVPVDIVIAKLTDFTIKAETDPECRQLIERFRVFIQLSRKFLAELLSCLFFRNLSEERKLC